LPRASAASRGGQLGLDAHVVRVDTPNRSRLVVLDVYPFTIGACQFHEAAARVVPQQATSAYGVCDNLFRPGVKWKDRH